MHICPHCQQSGISVIRRAFLGPAVAATCTSCGGKVGVPWGKSMIAFLPMVLSFIGANFLHSSVVAALVMLVGAVATSFFYHR